MARLTMAARMAAMAVPTANPTAARYAASARGESRTTTMNVKTIIVGPSGQPVLIQRNSVASNAIPRHAESTTNSASTAACNALA
jgi:hypothetical protein